MTQVKLDQHIEELDVLGYTVLPDILPLEVAEEARRQVERLYRNDPGVAAKRSDEYSTYHIECLMNKGEIFESYFLNPAVLPFAEHFLGADFIAQDVWSFGVPPGAPAYRLHADDDVRSPGTPLSLVSIYPLVDFNRRNGATRAIPGTHWRPDYPQRDHDYPGEVSIQAKVGSCILLFGSVWHSSGANLSDQIRTSMSCYFSRPWIKQYVDIPAVIDPAVLQRASPDARRILGFRARTPYTERWQWDREAGLPL
jgi:ectoine hydroxylase-related dioxygenase (phytanoyl-CoA dioxygenase family)